MALIKCRLALGRIDIQKILPRGRRVRLSNTEGVGFRKTPGKHPTHLVTEDGDTYACSHHLNKIRFQRINEYRTAAGFPLPEEILRGAPPAVYFQTECRLVLEGQKLKF